METPSQTEARERRDDSYGTEFERICTDVEFTKVGGKLLELLQACEDLVLSPAKPQDEGEEAERNIAKDLLDTLGVPGDVWTIADAVELVMERKKL